jgi:hypothetical protein
MNKQLKMASIDHKEQPQWVHDLEGEGGIHECDAVRKLSQIREGIHSIMEKGVIVDNIGGDYIYILELLPEELDYLKQLSGEEMMTERGLK